MRRVTGGDEVNMCWRVVTFALGLSPKMGRRRHRRPRASDRGGDDVGIILGA